MFDVAPTEFLLVAVIALVVIGPKDLPKAMRVLGYWVGRMRGVARQFRSGFDNMVREAELEEMEKRWAAENARIMAEHPAVAPADPADLAAADAAVGAGSPDGVTAAATPAVGAGMHVVESGTTHDPFAVESDPYDATAAPIFVEQPQIRPAPGEEHPPRGDGANS